MSTSLCYFVLSSYQHASCMLQHTWLALLFPPPVAAHNAGCKGQHPPNPCVRPLNPCVWSPNLHAGYWTHGFQCTAPWAHPVCDNSKLLFAIIFLILHPANQEAGSETRHMIGWEEKWSYWPPKKKREETQKKLPWNTRRRRCRLPPGGSAARDLDGVSAGLVTDRPNRGVCLWPDRQGGWIVCCPPKKYTTSRHCPPPQYLCLTLLSHWPVQLP